MINHRVNFLLFLMLLFVSIPVFADFTDLSLAEPDEDSIISCAYQRIMIRVISDTIVDPSTIELEINDSTFTIGSVDSSMFSWSASTGYLEYNPGGGDEWTDGAVEITLHPVTDAAGATSTEQTWTFYVDRTAPELLNPYPSGITVNDPDFEISFEAADQMVSVPEATAGLNPVMTSVTIGDVTIGYGDLNYDGTSGFSFNPADQGIAFEDGEIVIVNVHLCDLAENADCDANCTDYPFQFTMGETPCYREPNPITPGKLDGINDVAEFRFPDMRNTSLSSAIHIFDLQSNKVREITAPTSGASWEWDGTDDEGKPCGQGAYIYVIEQGDEVLCDGTITIIR